MNSVLIIDKPAGLTSHDVVNRLRRILRQRSIGHLGTLDPLATGVLPMVTGSMTRLAQFYTGAEKSYEGVVRFGFATDTQRSNNPNMSWVVGDTTYGSLLLLFLFLTGATSGLAGSWLNPFPYLSGFQLPTSAVQFLP